MESRGLRYFIGFVTVIGLLIFLIVLIFGGNDDAKQVPETSRTLSSYAQGSSQISMLVDGRVNSETEHRQIEITVDKDNVLYQVKKGYEGEVITSRSFPNSTASYSSFLLALEHANFNSVDAQNLDADPRGYCPRGQRYIFELNDAGSRVSRSWATSCGKPKTFLGEFNTVTDLFRAQVPEYRSLADPVNL